MPLGDRHDAPQRLAWAIALPFLAGAVQGWLWDDLIRPYVWFLFFPATFASAWLAGWRGGLGGTAISALLVWYYFMPPARSFQLETRSSAFSLAAFVAMGLLFAAFFERYHRSRRSVQSRYDLTFEHAPVGMAELGPDGRWLRLNDRFCDILGYPREELLRRGPQALHHPDDAALELQFRERLLRGDLKVMSREKRYLRADGSIGWIHIMVSPVAHRRGRPEQFISVIEDIGPRKAAEAALRLSEQHFRDLVEHASSAILHWSVDGRISYANAFAQRLFGWTAEELIGQPVSLLLPDNDSAGADLSGLVADIAAHPERYRSTANENVCRDGRRLWMTWTNSAMRDAEGRVTSILAVGSDVTELRTVSSALRDSEDRIRFVLEAAHIGAWELDLETGVAQRSSLHDELYGYPERAASWTFDDFLAHVLPDDREAVRDSHRRAVAQGSVWSIECRLRRYDGQVRWIWVAGMPVRRGDGQGSTMSGITQDITRRKRAEIELHRQAEELRRRNDELERFNQASIGRELRMVELKREVNACCERLGEPPRYDLEFGPAPDEGASRQHNPGPEHV